MVYHTLCSAYGWTIEEVNKLTLPQVLALMQHIRRRPPTNFILSEVIEGMVQTRDQKQQEMELMRIPNVETERNEENGEPARSVFTPSGGRIVKAIVKKTGLRVI